MGSGSVLSGRQKYLAALLFVSFLPGLVLAQSFRGSIRGRVVDPHGNVIAGAKVSAKNNGTGLNREVLTGSDGSYVLAELPVGEYTVTAAATGLAPVAQNIIVSVGLDTTADFDLTSLEKRAEELTVTAEAPVIEENRDVLGEVVDRQLVNELPLNGRDFGKLVALTPGSTVDPSGVAGTQGDSVNSTSMAIATAPTTTRSTAQITTIRFSITLRSIRPASAARRHRSCPLTRFKSSTCSRSSLPNMAETAVPW